MTFLASLASRLRLHAHAVRGIAARAGGAADSPDTRTHVELAGDLETIAERLDAARDRLCERCGLLEVLDELTIAPTD